jgi:hypothetical protein
MRFRIWCRWGELPIDAANEYDAVCVATEFAVHIGMSVILMDEDRNEIALIPPAPQTDMIPAMLFNGVVPAPGLVARN